MFATITASSHVVQVSSSAAARYHSLFHHDPQVYGFSTGNTRRRSGPSTPYVEVGPRCDTHVTSKRSPIWHTFNQKVNQTTQSRTAQSWHAVSHRPSVHIVEFLLGICTHTRALGITIHSNHASLQVACHAEMVSSKDLLYEKSGLIWEVTTTSQPGNLSSHLRRRPRCASKHVQTGKSFSQGQCGTVLMGKLAIRA